MVIRSWMVVMTMTSKLLLLMMMIFTMIMVTVMVVKTGSDHGNVCASVDDDIHSDLGNGSGGNDSGKMMVIVVVMIGTVLV